MNIFDKETLQLADLKAVLALLECGTVTRAAQKLGMTQSALSYQLDRMRKRFSDPLFVRVGNRMAATPFALRLAEPATRVLRIIDVEIGGLTHFDPLGTEREFRIGVNEIGAITLLPRLVKRLAEQAPHARLTPVQLRREIMSGALESGEMDLAVGHLPSADSHLFQQLLYQREYVCIARSDHPYVGDSLTLKKFSKTPQLHTPAAPVTTAWMSSHVPDSDGSKALPMITPHIAAIPFIVAASNYIAIIPQELYELFKPIAKVKAVALPKAMPIIEIRQYWHPRVASDPAIKFLRELVFSVAREPI